MLANLAVLLSLGTSALAGSVSYALAERATPDLKSLLSQPQHAWCSGTQVFFPGQANYANLTTQRWSTYEEPTYFASVKPACVQDVITVVKIATANNIPFLTTGGGHSFSINLNKIQNGLELDMGGLKSVNVDKAASTMTITGAITFIEVVAPLYAAGKEIPTGSCGCVGFVGGTMGAGVGRYQGIHGLIIDSLLSVDLVTAAGNLVTASATQNSDLFWGFRGAGMNFGVVTSATYQVHDLTNGGEVQDADMIFLAPQNVSYFNTLASLSGTLPPELSLISYVAYNSTAGVQEIILNAVYPGPMATFMTLIKPFLDLQPVVQVVHTLTWSSLLETAGFALDASVCAKGKPHSGFATGVKNLSAPTFIDAFDKYGAMYAKYPETQGSVLEIEFFPTQAVLAVPDAATAYPWRAVNAQVMFEMAFPGSATSPAGAYANALAVALRSEFVKTNGLPQMEIYVSYAHGDEDPIYTFGAEKLPRLVALKNLWDPKDVFSHDKPIPQKWP
ncbi:hypothetical protein HO133_010322 [Letharia lupina]|uniref:FAD-binding PCMH-type domain-containing protein n=1 Tax=Letharia lupina TaxID=560253 RepID=A0A8H6FEI2_9LECA|nr:uncharacterized protein HO133_010322 [Letharia lupina]KAF6225126.1 hypothetical protein HO133_010322 [Letharia lupina]